MGASVVKEAGAENFLMTLMRINGIKTCGRKAGSFSFACLLALAAVPSEGKPKGKPAPPLGTGISVVSTNVTFVIPDPKFPGKPLFRVQAKSGGGSSLATGFLGNLKSVSATLYQKGVGTAFLTAPLAKGNNIRRTVVLKAYGGVRIHYLLQPGTEMRADTVTWYASIDKVVGQGHVFYRDKTGATMTGHTFVGHTQAKDFIIQ